MSKIAPTANVKPANVEVTATEEKTEEKPVKAGKAKPGLASNLIVLKALEASLSEVAKSGDAASVRIMTDYVKTQHRRMRPWAKKTQVEYGE
jgi:hypothetical protein